MMITYIYLHVDVIVKKHQFASVIITSYVFLFLLYVNQESRGEMKATVML